MFKSIQRPGAKSRIVAAAAAAVAAVGLTACAASGAAPAATPATTVTQTAQASPVPAASNPTAQAAPANTAAAPAAPASTAAAQGGDTLPEYKPSTFLSASSDTTVLLSPDSVDKVAAFYENALKSGGWQWHATAKSRWSAHFEAAKGSAHTVIQISSTGKGASIAVTIIK